MKIDVYSLLPDNVKEYIAEEDRRLVQKSLKTNVVLLPSKNSTFDGFYYSSSW